jgi:uncharacterized protein with HEPN domain
MDDLVYISHMLETARKAHEKVEHVTRAEFDQDENLRLATTHLLQIVGEAAARVSRSFRDTHSGIPWAAIIGMRNRVVHDYLHVDEDIVWDTARNDLVPLIAELEKIKTSLQEALGHAQRAYPPRGSRRIELLIHAALRETNVHLEYLKSQL